MPGVCDRCGATDFTRRKDDAPQAVRERLAAYRAQTAPLLPYYRAAGILAVIDGMAAIEAVARAIEAALLMNASGERVAEGQP